MGGALLTNIVYSYTKIITRGMAKNENLLKCLLGPADPDGFVETYLLLTADTNLSLFLKIVELKVHVENFRNRGLIR